MAAQKKTVSSNRARRARGRGALQRDGDDDGADCEKRRGEPREHVGLERQRAAPRDQQCRAGGERDRHDERRQQLRGQGRSWLCG
jgi:hypothetical protein